MILIIDNYDSFTYNIIQYVGEITSNFEIKKNDSISIDPSDIKNKYSHIIISPGPGNPENSGQCIEIVKECYSAMPILGICLGHQVIAKAFGGKIVKHSHIVHGKTSIIYHNGESKIYDSIPLEFEATRYHSLIIEKRTLSNNFIVNAVLDDGSIMGIEHKSLPVYGVQYHPESIKTENGKRIIKNFINIV